MNNSQKEKMISDYIDALNEEKDPEKILRTTDDPELAKLFSTVRKVRTLREPAMPEHNFPQRLAQKVADKLPKNKPKKRMFLPAVALVAGIFLFALLISWPGIFNHDVVYAMEKAVAQLTSYHGTMEKRSQNAAGEEWMVSRVEFWVEGDKYAVRQDDGTVTVNNGEQKWQIRPQSNEVALLPVAPDPTGEVFDLRDEAKRAKQYPHKVVGTEKIAGREAVKLEISPPGGLKYYLWIDTETNLPIQLQTAMQKALQTTYTFVKFEPNINIDPKIFAFQPPKGYTVVEKDPGQLVAGIEEAAAISGFTPLLPQEAPNRIIAFEDKIVLDYGDTTIVETVPQGDFQPAANAALGSAAGGPLEVLWEQLRWRQDGLEIQVEGRQRVELARQITADLKLPDGSISLADKAEVKVEVDMAVEKANQQQVDAGSSPWQLDPMQVALTFVNLQVTPEGIVGEPTIPMSAFKLTSNNGLEAVVEVADGPVERVYLKRLLRQDESGIWTVVGYDRR